MKLAGVVVSRKASKPVFQRPNGALCLPDPGRFLRNSEHRRPQIDGIGFPVDVECP